MALHRDIFWVGKQWAVTGHGLQAVDQKQKSKFDIEASRLWEDDLLDALSDQRWFNEDDFNTGLTVARAKYPEAPAKAAARKKATESARAPVVPPKPAVRPDAKAESKVAAKAEPKIESAKPDAKAKVAKPQPAAESAKPALKAASPKPEAAPPAPKLAITSGPAHSTITAKSRPKRNRPAAQLSMRIMGCPAKFTQMWRIRVGQK